MENEMPARPRCSEGAAGVCLSEKQRWTHMIDFLTFPGPCSRQSARKAAVTQRKKMVLIDLLDSIGVQSVDLEGSKKCSSAPLPRTSIITDGWAIWALTRTKEDRMCQKKKKGWWKATPRQGRVPVCYVDILTLSFSLSWLKVSELSRRLTPSAKKSWKWNEATAQNIAQSV